MDYYLYLDGETAGPYSEEQLAEMLAEGQVTPDTSCCPVGDQAWVAISHFIHSPVAEGRAAPTGPFIHSKYTVRRKFKLLGGAFHIYGPDGNIAFYSKQKAFKLKEDIRVYTSEDMQTDALFIHARSILDFSAAYDVVEPGTGYKIGALKRKGLKSVLRDEWTVMDENDQEIGLIQEDSMALALVRRYLTNLLPQKYSGRVGDAQVCTFKQHFNPFIMKVTLDFSADANNLLDRRLGIAAAILLCAVEGRQD